MGSTQAQHAVGSHDELSRETQMSERSVYFISPSAGVKIRVSPGRSHVIIVLQ